MILTIALAVCLMGTLCFVYSARRLETLRHIRGQYQAGCGPVSHEEIERLVNAGEFEKWGYTAGCGLIRYRDTNLDVSFVDPGMIDLMEFGSIIGDYPQSVSQICVERAFLESCGLPVETGQRIELDLGSGEETYTVTGILERENASRTFMVWISETAAAAGREEAHFELRFRFAQGESMDTHRLQEEIDAFFEEMGITKDRIFYSSNYFKMTEIYLGSGMEIYALALIIALVCAVVIYNIFYISVSGRMREYGRLKVLGATPGQLREIIKRERNHLTVMAIPPGLLAAALIACIVMPGVWSWRDNIRYAIAISLTMYGVVVIAARKPLRLAGKVSAIEAVRASAYSQHPGRRISRGMHRRLSMPRLAWMNFSRNRKKAAVTSLSLSLTGILLVCVSAYAGSIDVKEMALSQFGDRSNYLLRLPYEQYSGEEFIEIQKEDILNAALQEELARIPGVDYVTACSTTGAQVPAILEGEFFEIRGLTESQAAKLYTDENILSGTADYRELREKGGILVCPGGDTLEGVYGAAFEVGDTITFSGYNAVTRSYTVQGIVKDIQTGSASQFFLLPQEELSMLYPEIENFTTYLNIHTKQDDPQLRRALFDTVTDERVLIDVLDDMVSSLRTNLKGELKLFYGIVIFVFLFSLINLANTLITSLLARQQEFGILQSVGMSSRQLSGMLSFECMFYVGITILTTLTIGVACSRIICDIFDQIGTFGKITYHFPVAQMLLFGLALFLVQAVFSVCAVRYCARLSLVERIRAIE